MIIEPIYWKIEKKAMLPVIIIVGRCKKADAEKLMLIQMVRFIEIAEKFNGKYFDDKEGVNSVKSDYAITMRTSYIFQNLEMLEKYFEYLKKFEI